MATILIVDDRPTNREVLVTLLGYKGHRLLEASDGAEGLAAARAEPPDLIISDILMPTMDGYEFVSQLRAEPALARTLVIFYTAHYLRDEADALARRCGVSHILTKPSKPAAVLSTVEAALASAPPPAAAPPAEEFEREHRRLITNKLSQKVNELNRVNKQLSQLIDLNLQLVSEPDPQQLLQSFCQAARELIGAKYATVSIHSKDVPAQRHFFSSGLEAEVAAQISAASLPLDTLAPLPTQHRPYHLRNYSGDPQMAGFPPVYPPFHTLLATPIISSGQGYGWFCLFDKVGAEEFNASDEQAAILLTTLVGRLYENRQLYAEVRRRAQELEQEMAERQQAEEAVREREERFRLIADRAPVLIWISDQNALCTFFNQPWLDFTGRTMEQELGNGWAEGAHPDDHDRCLDIYLSAFQARQEFTMEYRLRAADGEYRWIVDNGVPLFEGDRFIGYIGSCIDITERKRAEKELEQTMVELARSNAELEQFAYIASHDLQEPLRAIAGPLQLLQKRYAGQLDARADEFIQHAVDNAIRMQTLIADLLDLSRVGTRGQPFQPTGCAEVLTLVRANLAAAIQESDTIITHDLLPTVMADPTQLSQLFQNLIANAIKFRGDNAPVIHIGVEHQAGEWLFTVCDNGIGMEAQNFERIFGIFQRLHTRREYAGTGIGLAVCKKIVERHGGRIWVESEPGQGSTFYFTLRDQSEVETRR